MKITLNDFVINITVKVVNVEKINERDLLAFLNWLATSFYSGAKYNDSIGCSAIADEMIESARKLYSICDEHGFYKKII